MGKSVKAKKEGREDASFNGGLIPEAAGDKPTAPAVPSAPTINLGAKSAVATFEAAGQKVQTIKLQAVPNKKFKNGEAAFKKYKAGKNGCLEGVTNLKADAATRCTIPNVDPASGYYFRLVLVNAVGSVESPSTPSIPPSVVPKTAKELKEEAKAKATKDKADTKAAKIKAKEDSAAAKAAGKAAGKPPAKAAPVPAAAAPAKANATTKAKAAKYKAATTTKAKAAKSKAATPPAQVVGKKLGVNDDVAGRASKLVSRLEKEENRRESQPNMFKKTEAEQKKSRIFSALNPTGLAYVSQREKAEEAEEGAVELQVRGGFGGFSRGGGGPDFAKMRDDEGNIMESSSESEGEEEEFDGNVPDFGEFQGVLDEARKKRAKEEKARKDGLKAAWEKKKAAEEADRQKLLKKYAAEDIARKKKEDLSAADIKKAQNRISTESVKHMTGFTWN